MSSKPLKKEEPTVEKPVKMAPSSLGFFLIDRDEALEDARRDWKELVEVHLDQSSKK